MLCSEAMPSYSGGMRAAVQRRIEHARAAAIAVKKLPVWMLAGLLLTQKERDEAALRAEQQQTTGGT